MQKLCLSCTMAFLLYLIVAILAVMASPMDVIPKAYFNRSELRTTLLFGDLDQSAYSSPSIWESFRNRRIAFLGDSVMRYQYHVLAYFLVHRQWPQAEDKLCNHAHFKSWVKFMEYETGLMKGFEISETYRNDKMCCGGWTVCDNRQLHIPSLNATIWYFLWFGNQSSPHGHFSISKGLKKLCKPGHCTEHASKHPWMLTPAEFTFKFISAHNPDFFFLNCGLHAYPFDAQYPWGVEQGLHFEKILKKLKLMPHITTRVFWRATTPHTDSKFHARL